MGFYKWSKSWIIYKVVKMIIVEALPLICQNTQKPHEVVQVSDCG